MAFLAALGARGVRVRTVGSSWAWQAIVLGLGSSERSIGAWWAERYRGGLGSIRAVLMQRADDNATVGGGAVRLAAVSFRAHVAVSGVKEISPVAERAFRALHLRGAGAAGWANVASVAEVPFEVGHAGVRAVEGRRALVEGCLAWHTSKGSVVSGRGWRWLRDTLGTEVTWRAGKTLVHVFFTGLSVAMRASRALDGALSCTARAIRVSRAKCTLSGLGTAELSDRARGTVCDTFAVKLVVHRSRWAGDHSFTLFTVASLGARHKLEVSSTLQTVVARRAVLAIGRF